MPKVVVVVNSFPVTSETFIVDHVVGLVLKGFEVVVLASECFQEEKAHIEQSMDISFELILIPENTVSRFRIVRILQLVQVLGVGRLRALWSVWERDLALRALPLIRKIVDVNPDIIHAHFGPNAMMSSLAASQLNIPLFANFHGYDVTVIPKRHGWSAYRRWLVDAHAIVHSSFVEHRVKTYITRRVTKVRLGVDTQKFKAPKRASSWPHPLNFLVVGRAIYQKGIHVAIVMLSIFKHRFPHMSPRLTICGDGDDLLFFKQCAQRHGVEEDVTFLGNVAYDDVAREMQQADILLIPSVPVAKGWEEAFCRVAIEGMAMGLSVVGSQTGGLEETIGVGGRTFRAGSSWALFKAVENLILCSSPEEEAKKATARTLIFTIERMREEYAKVIA